MQKKPLCGIEQLQCYYFCGFEIVSFERLPNFLTFNMWKYILWYLATKIIDIITLQQIDITHV